ncbi:hypothetical protein Ndes2437A_g05901 [Nannochloris sp. 'desiccata']
MTFSCMVLNGAVFLGSITLLNWTIKPIFASLLSTTLPASTATATLRIFDGLFAIFWILPAYVLSYFVSCMWYGEIAERTAFAAQKEAQQRLVNATKMVAPTPSRLLQVRQTDAATASFGRVYRAFFLLIHFCVAMILEKLPLLYIGPCLRFIMFSTLYAFLCFDYKWDLHGVPLEHRTQHVENYWAYFSGFGALMVFVATQLPYFTGSAVGLVVYPLVIIAAADGNPKEAYVKVRQRYQQRGQEVKFPRLPLFTPTVLVTNFCLEILQHWSGSPKKTAAKVKVRN